MVAVISLAVPGAAQAATYTVGTTTDTSSAACPSATATNCSLRQLILYVEANPAAPDTINVPAGTYTVSGALDVTASMTIVGAGAGSTVIQEAPPANRSQSGDRVFDVSTPSGGSAPTVTLSGLKIVGGDANSGNGYYGGDIASSGTTTLSEDWVTNGFACSGAGVANLGGTLTVERSLISANLAACSSGGDDSGGVMNFGEPGSPDLPAHLTIDDSTIAGNAARLGAGIYSYNDATNTVTISNSTVADNSEQAEGGNAARGGGGGLGISTGTAQLQNSILAANTTTAGGGAGAVTSNCVTVSPVSSLGHNLEDANTCALTGPGDLTNTNPQLGVLADNGGPTQTLALAANSPALAQVPAASCSATDQRGVARPTSAGSCDIGAFELTAPSAPTGTTSSPTSSGSTPTPPPPPPTPQTSFTVGAQSPGEVSLAASTTDGGDVSRYQWTVAGSGGSIYCPVQEPIINLAAPGAVSTRVTLNAVSAGGQTLSSATNLVHITPRLEADRVPATTYRLPTTGECHGPISITVPPLTPKRPAAPPRGSVGGAPPSGCTDDLDFGAVDVHGCLAEVSDPKDLPGGITSELGEAICSSSGETLCFPSLVVVTGLTG